MKIFLSLLLSASSLFAQVDYSTLLLLGRDTAPTYTFSASYFTNAIATNALSGLANSQLGLFSLWFYREANQSTTTMLTVGGVSVKFQTPEPGIDIRNDTGTIVGRLYSNVNPPTGWHHLLISYDLSTAGRRQVYVDGTNRTAELTFTAGSTAQYVTNFTVIGGVEAAGSYAGALSQVYFAIPSSYYDISSGGNLANFWVAESGTTGNQVDLGADGSTPLGVQPILYWPGNMANLSNLGSGGGTFTTNHYTGGFIVATNAP